MADMLELRRFSWSGDRMSSGPSLGLPPPDHLSPWARTMRWNYRSLPCCGSVRTSTLSGWVSAGIRAPAPARYPMTRPGTGPQTPDPRPPPSSIRPPGRSRGGAGEAAHPSGQSGHHRERVQFTGLWWLNRDITPNRFIRHYIITYKINVIDMSLSWWSHDEITWWDHMMNLIMWSHHVIINSLCSTVRQRLYFILFVKRGQRSH